jgi:hypothetical protein
MYSTIFVNSLRAGILCVYDIVLDILFYMHGTIFAKYFRCGILCVYDIISDLDIS